MEPSVEQRLNFLEGRVKTLEGLLGLAETPAPAPVATPRPVWPPPRQVAPPEPAVAASAELSQHAAGCLCQACRETCTGSGVCQAPAAGRLSNVL